jgi:hypothetical protein
MPTEDPAGDEPGGRSVAGTRPSGLLRILAVSTLAAAAACAPGPRPRAIPVAMPPPALFPQSRCADCHFASLDPPAPDHLHEWDLSPHSRSNVGCEVCHGGDPTTFEKFHAHQGVLSPRDPASPVHRGNLSGTCGSCHPGPFIAFQKSRHFELLRQGDRAAPTCATCHGAVAAHLLSPKGLESQCAQCHGRGRAAERPEYTVQARRMLEAALEVRGSLDQAWQLMRRIREEPRRSELERAYRQAELPWVRAVDAGHQFVFDDLEDQLALARDRTEALLERLANPGEP